MAHFDGGNFWVAIRVDISYGNPTGSYVYNGAAANRALELLGKAVGYARQRSRNGSFCANFCEPCRCGTQDMNGLPKG
jgi:hypothetical protein